MKKSIIITIAAVIIIGAVAAGIWVSQIEKETTNTTINSSNTNTIDLEKFDQELNVNSGGEVIETLPIQGNVTLRILQTTLTDFPLDEPGTYIRKLIVETEKEYPDWCYAIKCDSSVKGKTVKVDLKEIERTTGLCFEHPWQARCETKLTLEDGSYTLELSNGSKVDTYSIEVIDNKYSLSANQTSFSGVKE